MVSESLYIVIILLPLLPYCSSWRPHLRPFDDTSGFCAEIVRFGKMWRTCRVRRHKAKQSFYFQRKLLEDEDLLPISFYQHISIMSFCFQNSKDLIIYSWDIRGQARQPGVTTFKKRMNKYQGPLGDEGLARKVEDQFLKGGLISKEALGESGGYPTVINCMEMFRRNLGFNLLFPYIHGSCHFSSRISRKLCWLISGCFYDPHFISKLSRIRFSWKICKTPKLVLKNPCQDSVLTFKTRRPPTEVEAKYRPMRPICLGRSRRKWWFEGRRSDDSTMDNSDFTTSGQWPFQEPKLEVPTIYIRPI